MMLLTKKPFTNALQAQYQAGYDAATIALKATPIEYTGDILQYNELDFALDFNNPLVNIFSIERVVKSEYQNYEHTIVGFTFKDEKHTKSWFLNCTRSQHNKLVKEWKDVLNSRITANTI